MSKKAQKQIDKVIREIDKLVDMPGSDVNVEEWSTLVSISIQLVDVRAAIIKRDVADIEFGRTPLVLR